MNIGVTFDAACGVDNRTAALWASALDAQVFEFCAAWGIDYYPVVLYSPDVLLNLEGDALKAFTDDTWLVTVSTSIDAANALGFHDDILKVIFARVLWQGDATAVTLSHEILEMLGDPSCDKYKAMANGKQQALEACDRVEGDTYQELGELENDAMQVDVSNYLLPSAFVPGSVGPWDRMRKLVTWDGLSPGGYCIVLEPDGSTVNVFALTDEGRAAGAAKVAKVGGRAFRRLTR